MKVKEEFLFICCVLIFAVILLIAGTSERVAVIEPIQLNLCVSCIKDGKQRELQPLLSDCGQIDNDEGGDFNER